MTTSRSSQVGDPAKDAQATKDVSALQVILEDFNKCTEMAEACCKKCACKGTQIARNTFVLHDDAGIPKGVAAFCYEKRPRPIVPALELDILVRWATNLGFDGAVVINIDGKHKTIRLQNEWYESVKFYVGPRGLMADLTEVK